MVTADNKNHKINPPFGHFCGYGQSITRTLKLKCHLGHGSTHSLPVRGVEEPDEVAEQLRAIPEHEPQGDDADYA